MPQKVYRDKQETTGKILAIFFFIFLFFVLFFTGTLKEIFDPHNKKKTHKVEELSSFRGSVKTVDGYSLAVSADTWYFAINGDYFKENKHPVVAKLVSIYTDRSEAEILMVLQSKKRVILNATLTGKEAKKLKRLSRSLDDLRVLKTFEIGGVSTRYGFEIIKNSIQKREYLYNDLLTPILGFVRKTDGEAITGIEKFYDEVMRGKDKGWVYAQKDIGGNIIYNNNLEHKPSEDGNTVILNIDSKLQKRVEEILSTKKQEFDAKEVIAGVMDSKTGAVVALATSNRYDPENILDVSNTNMSHLQYYFEPGSVIKPFFLAKAFELGVVKRFELFAGHNGRWLIKNKPIIDDVKPTDWMSAEDILIYSSNIGISKVALRLAGYEMRESLDDFGISKLSEIDLPYERETIVPTADMYDNSEIYKATSAYGYGFQTNFIRLLKGYNAFNNNGRVVIPKLANKMVTNRGDILPSPTEEEEVLSRTIANLILSILRKTAEKGTARAANVEGVFVAGKTGTAHIAEGGGYADSYNSSFFGFVNDENQRYTLGVTFIEPKTKHFSSQTAAPTAKEIILAMIEQELLKQKLDSE